MRRMLAVILSLLTGIGGHYLNRRWDRAAFFMGLLFVWMLIGFVTINQFSSHITSQDIAGLSSYARPMIYIFAGGFVVILIISALVTWRDGQLATRVVVPWQGAIANWGAVLSTFMAFVLLGYVLLVGSIYISLMGSPDYFAMHGQSAPGMDATTSETSGDAITSQRMMAGDDWFWGGVHFGGESAYGSDAKPMPSGDAYLIGVVVYQAAPVAGAQLKLRLNGEYESKNLITDAQGRFTLRVPPGEWFINSLEMDRWPGKPDDGEYMLVSAGEGAATEDGIRQPRGFSSGLLLTASVDPVPAPALVIDIRKHLHLAWPSAQKAKIPAQMADGAVRWDAYPEAVRYRVEISEVERRENSASYTMVTMRTVEGATSLPLSTLASVEGDTESREYTVKVTALADDGRFLSESEHAFDGGSFTLTDGHRLLKDNMAALLDKGMSPDDVKRMLNNDKRLEAVVVLVREGMLDVAEPLLAKVDIASLGRKAAVTGFLRASQNRCEEATVLLTQAMSEGGSNCVPAEYWAECR